MSSLSTAAVHRTHPLTFKEVVFGLTNFTMTVGIGRSTRSGSCGHTYFVLAVHGSCWRWQQ